MKTIQLLISLLLLGTSINTSQAQQVIQGTVTFNNHPLKGVIVAPQPSEVGTRTNKNGHYKINLLKNIDTLVFVYPGMKTLRVAIFNQQEINVTMQRISFENQADEEVSLPFIHKSHVVAASMGNRVSAPFKEVLPFSTESYALQNENIFKNALTSPLSTFAADVDRASYTNIRRFLRSGSLPPDGAVRIEEMLNYFKYDLSKPEGGASIAVYKEMATCPWNVNNQLVFIGIQGKEIPKEELAPSNFVLLIDVSGSMSAQNKLPLVKSSLKMLINQMRDQDQIAIVTYSGNAKIHQTSTTGENKKELLEAVSRLTAGGATAGGEGLSLAYRIASENYIENGNNRIIMATDGDFNIGNSSNASMKELVSQQAKNHIYMTVLGFGMGNYKDSKLETIADYGNGNYAYIDNATEAHKFLIREFTGSLYTIADDLKIQVEFNPYHVKSYRLIGYENRQLNAEDFEDNKKDAGEIGAGHQMVALYEIIPNKQHDSDNSTLRYQHQELTGNISEILNIKLRYKLPTLHKIETLEVKLRRKESKQKPSSDFVLAASIAEFGMLLQESEFKADASTTHVREQLLHTSKSDVYGYLGELLQLVETYESIIDSGLTN